MENINTEIIESELKLERAEDKFQLLFKLSPLGMAMIDQETGEFLEVNESLLKATGYTKEEFINLSFWDITPKKYEKQELKQMEQLNKTGKFGPNEKEYIKKDGTLYPIRISGFSAIDTDGKKVAWGLIEDITKEKQNETIITDTKNILEYITIENSLKKILDRIVKLAQKRVPNTRCSVLLIDETKQFLLNGSAPDLPSFYNDAVNGIKIGENIGSCGSAAFKKQRVIVEDIDTHENWQPYLELTKKANLHACWSEPIISSTNEILGTFAIYNEKPIAPSDFELQLIEAYSSLAAKAIEKDNYTKNIKEKEHQLNQLFNNAQSGLLYISQKREVIRANNRFATILGYDSPEELIGISLREVHLNQEKFIEFGKNNFDTMIREKERFNIEYELRRKDGSPVWCEMSGKALDINTPADLSKGILWTINDISLAKKYEEDLKESELLLKNILSTIPDIVWVKDINGKYLVCNEEFEKLLDKKKRYSRKK